MNTLLQKEFGFQQTEINRLDGYENTNYLVKTNIGKYIFKTYPVDVDLKYIIVAESEILLSLVGSNNECFPKPVQFADGSYIKILRIDGKNQICRMLSFLEGEFLGNVKPTEELFHSFGDFLANMDIALQDYTNHTIKARQWEWDLQYIDLNKKYINDIPNARDRNTVNYVFQQYEENVRPFNPQLRKQLIHNDANEWNVLVQNGTVSGIIDFGDLAYSFLINELAIAITYACFNTKDPLKWASIIIKSYHSKLSIKENEIKVLYYLIVARLSVSVCNSAYSRKINPDNTYASISEKSAWKMLYHWLSINPIQAENIFRAAIGLTIEKTTHY